MTYLHAFSRAWHGRHVFASSFDWFIWLFTAVVIGQSNYFGFGFTTLKWKPLYIAKVFERIINDNDLLATYQSGFRSVHITLTSLLEATDSCFVKKDNGLINSVIFTDWN